MKECRGIAGDILDKLERSVKGTTIEGTSRKPYGNKAMLSFSRDELMYDIRNIAYVESDVLMTEDEHVRHQIADIGEDGNVDRVNRIIDLAFAKVREMLFPYSKQYIKREEYLDNTPEDWDYAILLKIPDDYSRTTLDYLEKLIHEFVVCRVLSDWMSITNPNDKSALNWAGKIEELESEIDSTIHARMRRVRRTQTPF